MKYDLKIAEMNDQSTTIAAGLGVAARREGKILLKGATTNDVSLHIVGLHVTFLVGFL